MKTSWVKSNTMMTTATKHKIPQFTELTKIKLLNRSTVFTFAHCLIRKSTWLASNLTMTTITKRKVLEFQKNFIPMQENCIYLLLSKSLVLEHLKCICKKNIFYPKGKTVGEGKCPVCRRFSVCVRRMEV